MKTPADGSLLSAELRLAGRLDARFFALLDAVQRTGSINRAAATAGLSYKGAWLLLESACNLANEPLLETATGGAGGGGTQLTDAARGLLEAWHALQSEHRDFLRAQEERLSQHPALQGLLRRMSMKTSARNQFAGTVSAIDIGPVSAEVIIALKSGDSITATLTSAAARRLKLKKGKEALALIKASAVVLVSDFRRLAAVGTQPAGRHRVAHRAGRGVLAGGADAAGWRGPHRHAHQRGPGSAGPEGRRAGDRGVQGLCGDGGHAGVSRALRRRQLDSVSSDSATAS